MMFTPHEGPYDISQFVSGDGVTDVEFSFNFAIVNSAQCREAHQPPILNEIVIMFPAMPIWKIELLQITFFRQQFSPKPGVFIRHNPSSWPILHLINSESFYTLYEFDHIYGQLRFKALLEIIPIICWQSFAIVDCLNRQLGGMDPISALQLVQPIKLVLGGAGQVG